MCKANKAGENLPFVRLTACFVFLKKVCDKLFDI